MKINDIRKMAKGRNINTFGMRKPNMIRSIQNAESNIPCFGTSRVGECGELACLWRSDCEGLWQRGLSS